MHLVFKVASESDPRSILKLKVEINTREHATLLGLRPYPFAVEGDWYQANVEIDSFAPEELFGTKLRALLQRRKSRDMFDWHHGLEQLEIDDDKLVACFHHYLKLEGQNISRAVAEQRMLEKLGAVSSRILPRCYPRECPMKNQTLLRGSTASGGGWSRNSKVSHGN